MHPPPTTTSGIRNCQNGVVDPNSNNGGPDSILSLALLGISVDDFRPSYPTRIVSTVGTPRTNHQSLVDIIDEALSIMEEDDEQILQFLEESSSSHSVPFARQ